MSASQAGSPDTQLDRSIGLGRVLFQSIAAMGPGASVALGLGLIISYAGKGAPLAMLLGAVAGALIALVIGALAAKIPAAGGFYSYTVAGLGNVTGFLVGWAYSILYLLLACLSSLNFTIIGRDFCHTYLGFTPPYWVLGLLVVGVTFAVTYVGVKPSTGLTAILGTLEVAILLLVAILLIIDAGSANTLSVFGPHAAAAQPGTTAHAIFLGMVFAFAAITGFEAAAPMAEETENPRRTVSRAVLLSAVVIGAFYVLAVYTSVIAWGPDKLSSFIESANPWREMADKLGGFWAFLVVLALLNSVVAGTQAGMNALSRLLFAMGRAGTMPRAFGRLHPHHQTPYIAATVGAVVTLACMLAASLAFHGAFPAFIFFLTVASLVFIVLYGVMCIDLMVLFSSRWRSEFNVLRHVVVPVVGLALLAPTFYYSVHGLSYPSDRALPVLGVWMLIGIGLLITMRARGLDITAEKNRWLAGEEEPAPVVAEPVAQRV
jgi:amino acid transporter